jgi:hypothetical protein
MCAARNFCFVVLYFATAALTDSRWGVFLGMPFLAAGASSLPVLLGYLTDQVLVLYAVAYGYV